VLELNQIYAPISNDLIKVGEAIRSSSNVDFKWLAELLNQSLSAGGKRIRPALTLLCGQLYTYRLDILLHMATAIEMMHTATLIHDDAIDKSDMRRARPTIYKLWGTDPAILLGDYLFAVAGVEVSNTLSIRAINLFSRTLMIISSGELSQAKNAYNIHQDRNDYFQRIYGKTASLFCLSTESGVILGEGPETAIEALENYGKNLGLAFQIVDDILDFIGTEAELGKPAGSDLTQGTLTLPAMLLNEKYPDDNPVLRLFQDRCRIENVQAAIEQVKNSSIVDECYVIAREYCQKACRYLDGLPDKPCRQSLMELADFVVARKK
jgi:geranylgeranyl pyrophosphate synthase